MNTIENNSKNRQLKPGEVKIKLVYEMHNRITECEVIAQGAIIQDGCLMIKDKQQSIECLDFAIKETLDIRKAGYADMLKSIKLVLGYAINNEEK